MVMHYLKTCSIYEEERRELRRELGREAEVG